MTARPIARRRPRPDRLISVDAEALARGERAARLARFHSERRNRTAAPTARDAGEER